VVVADTQAPLRTRLGPPHSRYTAAVAARIADAAVADTLRAAEATPATVTAGHRWPAGRPGPWLLVRTDTPQLTPALLTHAVALAGRYDAVLDPTTGDGWWVFGLRDPRYADRLGTVPDSFPELGLAALRAGLRIAMLPELRSVAAPADVPAVARECPQDSHFAAAAARSSTVPTDR
jgi:glycosyltransferase A (GT-A) superfamily protein (DUF2064 family)